MSTEVATPATAPVTAAVTSAPAATVEAAPVVATNPVATQTPAPAAATLLAEPAPAAPTVAPEASKAPEAATTTPPVETKPVEAAKAPEGTTEIKDASKSDETAPPPSFEPFTLPEGVTLDAERLKQFTDTLGKFELDSKAGHDLVQKFGQEAVNFHLNELKSALETQTKFYQDHWDKTVTTWKDEFLADKTIGGNKFQTTVDAAREVIRNYGGTPEEVKEFQAIMQSSGLGNHKAVIRLLANVQKAMTEGKPLLASKPVQAPKSRTATLYGKP